MKVDRRPSIVLLVTRLLVWPTDLLAGCLHPHFEAAGSMSTSTSKYVLKGPIRTSQAPDGQHTDELTYRRGGGGPAIFGSHSAEGEGGGVSGRGMGG